MHYKVIPWPAKGYHPLAGHGNTIITSREIAQKIIQQLATSREIVYKVKL